MPRGRTLALLLACLTIALTAPVGVGATNHPIRPGSRVEIGDALCTLNFVFIGGGKTYIGTAGHCGKVGQRAYVNNQAVGTLRYSRDDSALDFALIEIDAARVGEVDPSVRSWGGPAGVTDEAETLVGDQLLFYGYGIAFGSLETTRPRTGLLVLDTDTEYAADMPAVPGDSGGPILHARTRKALGIISRFAFTDVPPTTDRGPTVEHILRTIRAAGFSVSLATA